jgi:N-formylmethionyl-tRNA deformylase
MALKIVEFPNEILNKKCPDVDFSNFVEYIKTIALLKETVDEVGEQNCLGLAAPQIGISQRVFIMFFSNGSKMYAVDPKIINHGKDIVWGIETCLSCLGDAVNVPRWRIIDVSYVNEQAVLVNRTLRGMDARIFQHELDHLNGLLIVKGG